MDESDSLPQFKGRATMIRCDQEWVKVIPDLTVNVTLRERELADPPQDHCFPNKIQREYLTDYVRLCAYVRDTFTCVGVTGKAIRRAGKPFAFRCSTQEVVRPSKKGNVRVVLPIYKVTEALGDSHIGCGGAHNGRDTTTYSFMSKYIYMGNTSMLMRAYIKNCLSCHASKPRTAHRPKKVIISKKPGHIVSNGGWIGY